MKKILIISMVSILLVSCKKDEVNQPVDTSQNPTLVSISVDGETSVTVVAR
jgi:hypothetical protein